MKNNSSNYINKQSWLDHPFKWQGGYGAFSYSEDAISNVYNYIVNQEAHHGKTTFKEEYLQMLEMYSIDYNDAYLFDWLE